MDSEKIVNLLKETTEILEKANLPAELRPAAFDHVWAALRGPATLAVSSSGGSEDVSVEGPMAKLAMRLKLENPTLLTDVFQPDGANSLEVVVPTNVLENGMAKGQRQVALLVCAARQATGEEVTEAKVIRDVCNKYGKLDSANFSQNMKADESLWIIGGSTQKQTFKLRVKGWEATTSLLGELAGPS